MKVSLVIPAYNEEKFLGRVLQAIQKQVVPPDEVIVVDNNSTDRTDEVATKFGAKVIKESEQGISHARNRGFNEAQYELIIRCDADCTPHPNWIKRIKDDFENQEVDALVGPVYYDDVPFPNKNLVYIYLWFTKLLLGHYPLNGGNMSLTKAMWLKVRDKVCQDDHKVHEDIDLSIHIAKEGGKIGYDKQLMMPFSGRRIKFLFTEYVVRYFKMIYNHR